uniref:Uncharacterized protein n=1 Tax=Anguilla anguilla TaxID=7936 RepID=A0A0E9WRB3_ANGAN
MRMSNRLLAGKEKGCIHFAGTPNNITCAVCEAYYSKYMK